MRTAAVQGSLWNRSQRLLIKTGRVRGVAGSLGRYVGRRIGCPMSCGYRLVINDPMEYVQRYVLACGVYEPSIAAVFEAVLGPGDLFFDVGANIGNHTLVAASRGATVHAFEPAPRVARRLAENLRFNRLESAVTVVQAAVGATPGTATLHVAERDDDGAHSLIPGVPARSLQLVEVPVVALDRYVEQTGGRVPTVIKIDVEGYEAKVLDGAIEILQGPTPPLVVMETGDRLADTIGESAASARGRLLSRGYRVFMIPDAAGPLREVKLGGTSGDLLNYLALHPRSERYSTVLDRLRLDR